MVGGSGGNPRDCVEADDEDVGVSVEEAAEEDAEDEAGEINIPVPPVMLSMSGGSAEVEAGSEALFKGVLWRLLINPVDDIG